ncbi:MAG: sulfatase [Bacteroidales bacterium]|nr:sulfatase [Bacteroidales bacterium]
MIKKYVLAVIVLSFVSCAKTDLPNFVVFLVDDLGWADVGCNNPETFYETPNVDKLASRGIRFTDAYAACPVCSPTRASIMTGKAPARINITDWIPGQDPKNRKLLGPQDLDALPAEEITLAEALKEGGYSTCYIGKWHLGGKGSWPEDHGFDVNIGGWTKGSPGKAGYYSPYENPRLPDGPKDEFLTRRLTNEAIKYLDSIQNDPFFLYFAFYTVHTPIQASVYHIDHFKEKLANMKTDGRIHQRIEHEGVTKLIQDNPAYASMVAAMDEAVGRVTQRIKDLGLDDNTYIIFTSDNGGLSTLKNRGYPTSNLPLRAGKGWLYEGGIREPFIIEGPEIETGVSHEMVISMDIYPTILELARLPLRPEQHVDGQVIPLTITHTSTSTPSSTHSRTLYWHYPHYHGSMWTPGAAIRQDNWKLIEFYEYENFELYNLNNDLSEMIDLSDSLPDKARELLDKLHNWQKEVNARFPIPNKRLD